MLRDVTNQNIATLLSRYDLLGKFVFEIGCGKGRITRDLAEHARHVAATDPDAAAVATALAAIAEANVTIMHTPGGMPEFPAGSFDLVIYTLSLHHIPIAEMSGSLHMAARQGSGHSGHARLGRLERGRDAALPHSVPV